MEIPSFLNAKKKAHEPLAVPKQQPNLYEFMNAVRESIAFFKGSQRKRLMQGIRLPGLAQGKTTLTTKQVNKKGKEGKADILKQPR